MPRHRRRSLDATLALLLGLGAPLPLLAADPITQAPTQAPPPAAAPTRNAPPPPVSPDTMLERRLEAVEDQLHALQRQQGFQPLQLPRSIQEILALLALPIAVLALALAVLQAQRNRAAQAVIRQRLKELRQEIKAIGEPATIPGIPAGPRLPKPLIPAALEPVAPRAPKDLLPDPAPAPAPAPPEPAAAPPPRSMSLEDWIAAVNSGQRDSLRSQAATQLNITKDSEDAIQMGRTDATCLEDVQAGGSYLRVTCGDDHWLLPTERTLASFRSFQPTKGVFSYVPMLSGHPQVQTACRLEPWCAGWRVVSPGVIRVPG